MSRPGGDSIGAAADSVGPVCCPEATCEPSTLAVTVAEKPAEGYVRAFIRLQSQSQSLKNLAVTRADAPLLCQDELQAIFEVCELLKGGAGRASGNVDWQQRICTLRQAGRAICMHASLIESLQGQDELPDDLRTLMVQLEHSLAKVAIRPHKRSNPSKRSGAAKKRFAFMRNKYSDFLGNDAIQVLALEPGSFIIALNALKLAAATFLLEYPHLFVGCS